MELLNTSFTLGQVLMFFVGVIISIKLLAWVIK